MTAHEFVPQFRTDVKGVIAPITPTYPNGGTFPINPRLCATDKTAQELVQLLSNLRPVLTQATPVPVGNIFSVPTVPALEFTDTDGTKAVILAGVLAQNFVSFGPVGGLVACWQEVRGTLDYNRELIEANNRLLEGR
jgi:hypothetical protein